jgi:CRP-like cAMP-binding protein
MSNLKVKIIKIVEDSEKILAILGPEEFFGEMSVLDGELCSATVITVEPTIMNFLFLSCLLVPAH